MITVIFVTGGLITLLFMIGFAFSCKIHNSVKQIQLQIAHLEKSREQQEYFYELVEGGGPNKLDVLLDYFNLEFNKIESKAATLDVKKKKKEKLT